MTSEQKTFTGIGIATVVLLIGGYFLATRQDQQLDKSLIGKEIQVQANHVPVGTEIDYNSNPPAGGEHYGDSTTHAGIYNKAPEDGYLVHSLEHGAVILWYKSDLPKQNIEKLKQIFNSVSGKKIMTLRKGLDVPIALSSWGRVLKLETIDEKQIKTFFETNMNKGPEQAPI